MRLQSVTSRPRTSRQQGVTFIELLISIAVLAILVAIAAPYFGDYIERQRLVGATEALYGQLQQAKRAAISNNKTIYFEVVSANSDSWIAVYGEQAACNGSADGCEINEMPTVQVTAEDYPTVEVHDGVTSTLTPITVDFNMPGISTSFDPSSSGSIELSSPSGWVVEVSVSPVGRVEICSDDVSQYPDC